MIYVADASSFLNIFNFDFQNDFYYTVPGVLAEIRDPKNKMIMNLGLSSNHLIEAIASKESIGEIKKLMNDLAPNLSETDINVLALALDFKKEGKKFELKTDDYQIQNLAFKLGVPFKSIMMKGIKKQATFYFQCSACYKIFEGISENDGCRYCGSKLIKKRKFL